MSDNPTRSSTDGGTQATHPPGGVSEGAPRAASEHRRSTLSGKLRQIIAAAALLPIIGIGSWGLITSREELRTAAVARQQAAANEAANIYADFFDNAQGTLEAVSVGIDWDDVEPGDRATILSTLLSRTPALDEVALVGSDGRELYRVSRVLATALLELRDRSGDAAFAIPFESGDIHFSPPSRSEFGSVVELGVPDFDLATGEPESVLIGTINLSRAEGESSLRLIDDHIVTFLVDEEGVIVAHESPTTALRFQVLPDATSSGFREGYRGTDAVLGAAEFSVGSTDYVAISEVPESEAMASWDVEVRQWLTLLGVASLIAVASPRLLTGSITRDLDLLGQAALSLGAGDTEARASLDRTDELGDLAAGFNHMADSLEASRREVELRRDELEDAYAELERFATVAAHDLQEPIRKVQTYGSLLGRSGDELSELTRSRLSRLLVAADELEELTGRLFDYTQVFRFEEEASHIDLEDLVDWCIARHTEEIDARGAAITKGPLHPVTAPSSAVALIVDELVTNALRFSPDEPALTVRIHSELGTEDDQPVVRIIVADNGEGFDPRFNTRIFQPFERLHAKDRFRGSGMGLAIARRFALTIGGELVGEGSPDGAAFTLTLPATQPLSDEPPPPKEEGP